MTAQEVLERGLSERAGRPVRVLELRPERLDTYSSHPISRLEVRLAGGERLRAIFKRLQPAPGKTAEHEPLVYERLLRGARHGAPDLYAAYGCWLFLEDVGDRRLDWLAADGWEGAFRAVARMHAAWAGRAGELRALGCLTEHGVDWYAGQAAAARATLGVRGAPAALARFERLRPALDPAFAYLAGRPRTLLHGDLSGHNVMVDARREMRPVDWEWAAIGPAAWDLGKLLAGWGERKPRFVSAYLDEIGGDRGALERDLDHCRVVKLLWYLRWWIDGCERPDFVDGLLDDLERSLATLERS